MKMTMDLQDSVKVGRRAARRMKRRAAKTLDSAVGSALDSARHVDMHLPTDLHLPHLPTDLHLPTEKAKALATVAAERVRNTSSRGRAVKLAAIATLVAALVGLAVVRIRSRASANEEIATTPISA